jgi:hypothetical protein
MPDGYGRLRLDLPVHTEQLLERAVIAIEKLADDPVLQVESGPPVCPHCGTINPSVTVHESDGTGPFATFLIEPECGNCGEGFFAIPIVWTTFQTYQDAEAELERRREVFESVNDE